MRNGEIDHKTTERIDAILEAYANALRECPGIPGDFDTNDDLLEQQTRSMLGEAYNRLRRGIGSADALSLVYDVDEASMAIGAEAAARLEHPAVPLMLAEVLFDTALPLMVEQVGDDADSVSVARALHRAIWRRFPQGAIAYTTALREQLLTSSADTRLGMARELHDRLGPAILAAIHAQESHRGLGCGIADLSGESLLRNALLDLQDMATNLRASLEGRSLSEAVQDLCSETVDEPDLRVEISGMEPRIRPEIAEELYAIIREAIRNARAHAQEATRVEVTCVWGPMECRVTVRDDGTGIQRSDNRSRQPWGIVGMAERAAVLGAHFSVTSDACGTSVTVRLPLDATTRG